MIRKPSIIFLASLVLLVLTAVQVYHRNASTITGTSQQRELKQFQFTQFRMAMPVTLTVWTADRKAAEIACLAAFKRIKELEYVFSDYLRDSELSQLNRAPVDQPVKLSTDLLNVLKVSDELFRQSHGAFDPSIGHCIQLWRKARKSKVLPTDESIQIAKTRSGWQHLDFNWNVQTVTKKKDVLLDLGGIAKGYIGDEAIRCLAQHDVEISRYQAGGDTIVGAAPRKQEGWEIETEGQGSREFSNCGVAVSGDDFQFVEIDGTRYSHVVNPKTGVGMTTRQSGFAVASSGTMSDAIATLGSIMERSAFEKMIEKLRTNDPKMEGQIWK